jgi:hypothetical protein
MTVSANETSSCCGAKESSCESLGPATSRSNRQDLWTAFGYTTSVRSGWWFNPAGGRTPCQRDFAAMYSLSSRSSLPLGAALDHWIGFIEHSEIAGQEVSAVRPQNVGPERQLRVDLIRRQAETLDLP